MAIKIHLYKIGINFCLLLALAAHPANAELAGPKQSLQALNSCIGKQDVKTCRKYVSRNSLSLYDRFMSYGLAPCLPDKAQYISQQQAGRFVVVRAGITQRETPKIMRLSFINEAGLWKLDAEESLRAGLGENWHDRVDMIEQLYLALRQQFGGQLNCDAIRGLAS